MTTTNEGQKSGAFRNFFLPIRGHYPYIQAGPGTPQDCQPILTTICIERHCIHNLVLAWLVAVGRAMKGRR